MVRLEATRPPTPLSSEKQFDNHAEPKAGKKVWWVNGAFVSFVHAVAAVTIFTHPWSQLQWQTKLLTYAVWQLATLGITMGYHRLWSHHSYKASPVLKLTLAWMGTLGFQSSIRWWVLRHRLHHRFTDDITNDPYSAKLGFWHSHMGWIFAKQYYPKMKLVKADDLDSDWIVCFQHKYYVPLALFNGLLLPALIGHYGWSDAMGSFLWAGYVARVLIWHVTFAINSFAHWVGEQDYSIENTSRGGLLIALFTNGEGYHNFHHEFPRDYRNGIKWYDWDPTKWAIWLLEKLQLASDLKRTPKALIDRCKMMTLRKQINNSDGQESFAPHDNTDNNNLMAFETVKQMTEYISSNSLSWCIIDGYAVDVGSDDFALEHPGGAEILTKYTGRDATGAFYGSLNWHTLSARIWMRSRRRAFITDSTCGLFDQKLCE